MKFNLATTFTFNTEVTSLEKLFQQFLKKLPAILLKEPTKKFNITLQKIEKNTIKFVIETADSIRPHNSLLQIKNAISKEFGREHHLGVRNISIDQYQISFKLDRLPLKKITIPFAKVTIKNSEATVSLENVTEDFLRNNYIDRIIRRIKEKIDDQYYEGKGEFWKLIWSSEKINPVWTKDPTKRAQRLFL